MENACLNLKIIIFLKFIACIYNIAYFLNKISIHIFAKMIFKHRAHDFRNENFNKLCNWRIV